jgi:hypothetical protein
VVCPRDTRSKSTINLAVSLAADGELGDVRTVAIRRLASHHEKTVIVTVPRRKSLGDIYCVKEKREPTQRQENFGIANIEHHCRSAWDNSSRFENSPG